MTKHEMLPFDTLAGCLAVFKVIAFIISLVFWKDDAEFVDTMSLSVWLLVYSIWGLVTCALYAIARRMDRDFKGTYCNDLCGSLVLFFCGGMYLIFSLAWQGIGFYLTFDQSSECKFARDGCTTIWAFSLMNIVAFWVFIVCLMIAVICGKYCK